MLKVVLAIAVVSGDGTLLSCLSIYSISLSNIRSLLVVARCKRSIGFNGKPCVGLFRSLEKREVIETSWCVAARV
jgi:hypothetical protein